MSHSAGSALRKRKGAQGGWQNKLDTFMGAFHALELSERLAYTFRDAGIKFSGGAPELIKAWLHKSHRPKP